MKIAHFGDVHFRPRIRHDEYKQAFEEFFDMNLNKDDDLEIVIAGDIVHDKTQRITPEVIDILVWWFQSLGDHAPTHVILGNHDGNLANIDRQDAISPIIKAVNHPNVFLYKESGAYASKLDERILYHAYSPFDEEGWEKLRPGNWPDEWKKFINIALFHGAVEGATTDVGYAVDGEVKPEFFAGYDYALLGDIHRHQYLDERKTIAYPGSTLQQDFGENINGHGFLLWDIQGPKKFSCKHVELTNRKPFVTVGWENDITNLVNKAKKFPIGSRFRVYNKEPIPQRDILKINNELGKLSEHVVYKFDKRVTGEIKQNENKDFKRNLRKPDVLVGHLKKFLGDSKFSKEDWGEIDNIVNDMVRSMEDDHILRNNVWTPRKIRFSNILKYGEDNVVDFDEMGGVCGIFAPNRLGKSTVIAAITFALFGKIDREINQNHTHGIVNLRKTQAEVEFYFTISGANYKIHRTLTRKEKKKGFSAQGKVWFYRMDEDWNVIEELQETKPQETDKKIRKYIGTFDDLKLTALAAQRNMEAFIRHKSTERKSILSRFRDLSVLQELHKMSADKFRDCKALVKNLKPVDFDLELRNLDVEKAELSKGLEDCESMIEVLNKGAYQVEQEIAEGTNGETFTKSQLEDQIEVVDDLSEKVMNLESECKLISERQQDLREKLVSIGKKKEKIPVEQIKEKIKKKHELEKKLAGLKARLRSETDKLRVKEKTVRKLDVVPCGDQFPTCRYIKDAHEEKGNIAPQEELITEIEKEVYKCESLIVDDKEYEELLKKHDDLTNKEVKYIKKLNSVSLETYQAKLDIAKQKLSEAKEREKYIEMRVSEEDENISLLKQKLSNIRNDIKAQDAKRMAIANRQGQIMNAVEKLLEDKHKYEGIYHDHKIYENLTFAFGKKGIPNQLLRIDLPSVNAEIREILRGVVDFDIELDVEEESDKLEIFIDYGDSRRPIELGSGMEQAVASMAIRVGLLLASSLPKPDFLILDEAFNGLDDSSSEDVVRLIESLKKWFKMILVVSHKDSVKNMADILLDIREKGKDSFISFPT
jgi:DNA repair exonuclease SbcCD ATPase subunit